MNPGRVSFRNRLNDRTNVSDLTQSLGVLLAISIIPNYFAVDSNEATAGIFFASMVTVILVLPIIIFHRIVRKTEEKKRANEIIEKMNLPSQRYRMPVRPVEIGISGIQRFFARLDSSPQGMRIRNLLVYGYSLITVHAGLIAYFSDSWYDVGTALALLVSIYACAYFQAWVMQFFIASWKTLVPNNKKQREQLTPHQSV